VTRPDFDSAHRVIDLSGEAHLWDFGGAGKPVLLIHGLGGSRASWSAVSGPFGAFGRVIVPDLIGFGDTPPESRSSGVRRQTEFLVDLIESVDSGPVTLVGNSMGGLISMLLAAHRPDLVDRLVLVAAAAPTAVPHLRPSAVARLAGPLIPGLGKIAIRWLLRGADPVTNFDRNMDFVMANPSRLDPDDRILGIEFGIRRQTMPWAIEAFQEAGRSIARTLIPPRRLGREIQRIEAPTLVIQGDADRIVPPQTADWLLHQRDDWSVHRLEGVGHVPQLEVPEDLTLIVGEWLNTTGTVRENPAG
jgi:pimeloyl-ACP methyl ester carboxylesterase